MVKDTSNCRSTFVKRIKISCTGCGNKKDCIFPPVLTTLIIVSNNLRDQVYVTVDHQVKNDFFSAVARECDVCRRRRRCVPNGCTSQVSQKKSNPDANIHNLRGHNWVHVLISRPFFLFFFRSCATHTPCGSE